MTLLLADDGYFGTINHVVVPVGATILRLDEIFVVRAAPPTRSPRVRCSVAERKRGISVSADDHRTDASRDAARDSGGRASRAYASSGGAAGGRSPCDGAEGRAVAGAGDQAAGEGGVAAGGGR